MEKIIAPSEEIKKFLFEANNLENLKKWIDLIVRPFEKFPKANWFEKVSVLDEGNTMAEETFENHPESFVRLDFPITPAGLYGLEKDTAASACLSLDINNKAEMVTELEKYYAFDSDGELVSRIEGTWEEVVTEYLKFCQKIMAVPVPTKV